MMLRWQNSANLLRYALTAILIYTVWHHAHWSVSLCLTLSVLAHELHLLTDTSMTLAGRNQAEALMKFGRMLQAFSRRLPPETTDESATSSPGLTGEFERRALAHFKCTTPGCGGTTDAKGKCHTCGTISMTVVKKA